jgi:hypothetical protein
MSSETPSPQRSLDQDEVPIVFKGLHECAPDSLRDAHVRCLMLNEILYVLDVVPSFSLEI